MGEIEKIQAVWRVATVKEIIIHSVNAKSFILVMADMPRYYAGQHVELRLTAPDGYQAVRDYSIASAPSSGSHIELTVQMLPGGEVSSYLDSQLKVGDQIEIKAPLGYYFIWTSQTLGPLTLIGGGSGLVPLMSIWREAHLQGMASNMNMLYSVRNFEDILYQTELLEQASLQPTTDVDIALTDTHPSGWTGYTRRIDPELIEASCGPLDPTRSFYICGPTPMVEGVANTLIELGYDAAMIKTERFGPSGPAPTPLQSSGPGIQNKA